jgi:micrococcal nuclease
VYVVDGDTIHVRLGDRVEKVRYLGVNAPEIPHPHGRGEARGAGGRGRQGHFQRGAAAGDAAKRVNLQLVSGQRVRLELDRQARDPHKRLLAYVWVGDTMVNAEMVKRGYAEVMSIPPHFHHRVLFAKLQAEAREAGRGLWQASARIRAPGAGRLHGHPAR